MLYLVCMKANYLTLFDDLINRNSLQICSVLLFDGPKVGLCSLNISPDIAFNLLQK